MCRQSRQVKKPLCRDMDLEKLNQCAWSRNTFYCSLQTETAFSLITNSLDFSFHLFFLTKKRYVEVEIKIVLNCIAMMRRTQPLVHGRNHFTWMNTFASNSYVCCRLGTSRLKCTWPITLLKAKKTMYEEKHKRLSVAWNIFKCNQTRKVKTEEQPLVKLTESWSIQNKLDSFMNTGLVFITDRKQLKPVCGAVARCYAIWFECFVTLKTTDLHFHWQMQSHCSLPCIELPCPCKQLSRVKRGSL